MSSRGVREKAKIIGKHFQRALAFLGALTLLAACSAFFFFLGIGYWLVKEDPLDKAAAIVVLSGHTPVRALEAASLFRQGYAKEIWLTHPGARADALREFGLRYPTEDDCNYQILRRAGVPAKAIHILDSPIVNTADELDVIATALQDIAGHTAIVVTDKPHTRRVRTLWNEFDAVRGKIIVHAVTDDPYDPARWWKTAGSTQQVMHEVLGMVDAWTGLPVQTGVRSRQRSVAERSIAENDASQPEPPHVVESSTGPGEAVQAE
jgi:uncharacterized SAM-binding protein YcdF (DUF218 family)